MSIVFFFLPNAAFAHHFQSACSAIIDLKAAITKISIEFRLIKVRSTSDTDKCIFLNNAPSLFHGKMN
jgi:hypothetical protein